MTSDFLKIHPGLTELHHNLTLILECSPKAEQDAHFIRFTGSNGQLHTYIIIIYYTIVYITAAQ